MYEISDSNKYAIVAVGRDDGSINALSVKDIDSRWSEDNEYEYILENEQINGKELNNKLVAK